MEYQHQEEPPCRQTGGHGQPHAAGTEHPRGKFTKAQLQEMATRWGLPISLITTSAATPKTLQQFVSAVTFLAV